MTHKTLHSWMTVPLTALTVAVAALDPAVADTLDIRKADNAIAVDFGASYLNYTEQQDSEKGWLPTVDVGVSLLSSERAVPWLRNLYLRIDGRASVGTSAFNGDLCDITGNCSSYQGSTDNRIYSFDGQIGRALTLTSQIILTPFIEAGLRHWNRDTLGNGGFAETFTNGLVMGGLLAQYSPRQRLVLSVAAAGGTTFSDSMSSGSNTYNLGNATIWHVQGKVGYLLTDRLELNTSAEYQSFSYGSSAVDANGYFEPNSTTAQTTVLVGAAYHFF